MKLTPIEAAIIAVMGLGAALVLVFPTKAHGQTVPPVVVTTVADGSVTVGGPLCPGWKIAINPPKSNNLILTNGTCTPPAPCVTQMQLPATLCPLPKAWHASEDSKGDLFIVCGD